MAAYWILHLALLLLSTTSHHVLAARQQHRHTISIESQLLSSSMCSSMSTAPVSRRGAAAGSTFQIVHRACLQTGDHKTVPDHSAILHRDRYRVRSIHRRLAGAENTNTTIAARLGLAFHSLEYVVTIGIGTPARNLTVLFDTGSDLTWVQCLPCTFNCYPQEEPLFDPSKSSTYDIIRCSAPECHIGGAQELSCGPSSSCQYSVEYGDRSETWGNLAKETFTLSPQAPPATGVVFGCSQEYSTGTNQQQPEMRVAGLLGLGQGDSSILSQTRQGNFSYCLPPRGASTSGYLTLGGAVLPPQSSNLSYTPMITGNSQLSSMYVVNLTVISVNGAALPIPGSAFSMGAIIDSGTVVTHLPLAAYNPLRDEFRRHMRRYKLLPEELVKPLDTCYDVTGQDTVTAPPVALEFDRGATIDVDASGILYVFAAGDDSGPSVTVACLAFLPLPPDAPGLVIVGNMQQRAYNVVFDVEGGRMAFAADGCS